MALSRKATTRNRTCTRRLHGEPLEDRRMLATFAVTNPLDDPTPFSGSLREVAFRANLNGQADTINILVDNIQLNSALGPIPFAESQGVTVNGVGVLPTRIDSPLTSVIQVTAGNLTLNRMTLRGNSPNGGGAVRFLDPTSTLNINNVSFPDSTTQGNGGALYTVGTTIIDDSSFTANGATGDGGAIYATAPVIITSNTSFVDNSSQFNGGAIFGTSTLSMTSSSIVNNTADNDGGGIFSTGNVTLDNTEARLNLAGSDGGAILIDGADLTLLNFSEVERNQSVDDGGGISVINGSGSDVEIINSEVDDNLSGEDGGGLHAVGANVTVTSSIVDSNTAQEDGGGLFLQGGSLDTTNSTFRNNDADTARGGGVFLDNAQLTVLGSDFEDNTSQTSGGGIHATNLSSNSSIDAASFVDNSSTDGGGAYLHGSISIEDTTFQHNSATVDGGGLFLQDATNALVNLSTFENNSAYLAGGGLYAVLSNLTVDDSDFEGNSGTYGGALAGNGGTLTTSQNTVTNNSNGFDLANQSVTMDDDSFVANQGFGLRLMGGSLDLEDMTFDQNAGHGIDAAGQLVLRDSIITGNQIGVRIVNNASGFGQVASTTFENNATGLSSTNGELRITASEMANNGYGLVGNDSYLRLSGTTLRDNSLPGAALSGGKLRLYASQVRDNDDSGIAGFNTEIEIINSTISGNTAPSHGGGVFAFRDSYSSAIVTVHGSRFYNNHSGGRGGGIANEAQVSISQDPVMHVENSSFWNNSASDGGAISIYNGLTVPEATVLNSTLSANSASDDGGGIFIRGGILNLLHSTVTQNIADSDGTGGGDGGGVDLPFATPPTNSFATISNSIISDNTATNVTYGDLHGTGATVDHSILSTRSVGFVDAGGNITGLPGTPVDAKLAPLLDTGSGTPVHTLLPNSPALDAGDAAFTGPPTLDQRGRTRIVDGDRNGSVIVDMGSVEQFSLVVDTLDDSLNNDISPGDFSLREAILIANTTAGEDFISFSSAIQGQTINLQPQSNYAGQYYNLKITDDVTIEGNVTVDAQGQSRVFYIVDGNSNATTNVTVDGLTLTGGSTTGSGGAISSLASLDDFELLNATVTGNTAGTVGSAIALINGGSYPSLTVQNSTITGNVGDLGALYATGDITVTDSTLSNNTAQNNGGAIFNVGGAVQISGSLLEDNRAVTGNGGALFGLTTTSFVIDSTDFAGNAAPGGAGGAIWADGSVSASVVSFHNNSSNSSGGGLRVNNNYSLSLDGVSFDSNTSANGSGGGLFSFSDATVTGVTFTGNDAGQFGGAAVFNGTTDVSDSRFRYNSSGNSGGAIRSGDPLSIRDSSIYGNSASVNGGGIDTYSQLTIVNSTISGNSADNAGGGLWPHGSHNVSIYHSTIAENVSDADQSGSGAGGGIFVDGGSIVLDHTIVAYNQDYTNAGDDLRGNVAMRYSIIEDDGGATITDNGGNIIAGSPRLGPLTVGKSVPAFHALLPGSDAINAGDIGFSANLFNPPLTLDQRDFDRTFGQIDIGSFEYRPLIVTLAEDELDGDYSYLDLSLREAIMLANDVAGEEDILFSPYEDLSTLQIALGPITITDSLNVRGLGADQSTIDAQGLSGIFDIGSVGDVKHVTISDLTLTGGRATEGGAIHVNQEILTLRRTVLTGNSATDDGGAVYLQIGSDGGLYIYDSAIVNNSAGEYGGGLFSVVGGAVPALIANSTISGNVAGEDGGGITTIGGSMHIRHSTITENTADTLSTGAAGGGIAAYTYLIDLDHTIVANNSVGGSSTATDIFGVGPTTVAATYSLLGNNDGFSFTDNGGNLVGSFAAPLDPLLTPLANNGGTTPSHMPSLISPVVDSGDPTASPGTGTIPQFDQRSGPLPRTANYLGGGQIIDIGAVERFAAHVTVADDEFDSDFSTMDLSLREALFITNQRSLADAVTFDPALAGQTILLAQGALPVRDDVTVAGLGADQLTIDGNFSSIVFDVDDLNENHLSEVALSGLTITGGMNPIFLGEEFSGGGVRTYENLTISSSNLFDNSALNGGAVAVLRGHTEIESSYLANNYAFGAGGAVVSRSTDANSSLTIRNSTIVGNTALAGGGVGIESNTATIIQSTVSENTAGRSGGGIYVDGQLTIEHSTVTANQSPAGAGLSGDGTSAGTSQTTVRSTIIAGNLGDDLAEGSAAMHFISAGYNLIGNGDGTSQFTQPGDQVNVLNPGLGELSFNGGTLPTHAPLSGSPAIDGGDPLDLAGMAGVPDFDQRGMPNGRVADGDGNGTTIIDIGAVEVAAPLVVDNLIDEDDGDFSAGDLSLREALGLANADDGLDTISFDPSLFGQTLAWNLGELVVSSSLRLVGPGADQLTIDAGGNSRFFNFSSPETRQIEIEGITFTNGNSGSGDGGAIRSGEDITLRNTAFIGNSGNRGGVFDLPGDTHLTLIDSTFENNSAAVLGGVLFTLGGELTIDSSTFTNNFSAGDGGALMLREGTAEIVNSTFSGNSANGLAGAIRIQDMEHLSISHSTLTANIADADGNNAGLGGAIWASSNNSGPVWSISHSIIAGNMDLSGTAPDMQSFSGLEVEFSLIGDDTGANFINVAGNQIGTSGSPIDPLLGPLQDNGGTVMTHALLSNSPAIDAGSTGLVAGVNAPTYDSRGMSFDRIVDGDGDTFATIDIGAYEVQTSPTGDFDGDGDFDLEDVDALVDGIIAGLNDPQFDLTQDGLVDQDDLTAWLAIAGAANLPSGNPFLVGDSNLDGAVDGADFIIWNDNKFTSGGLWSGGDFNADGSTDGQDFIIWNDNKFQSSDSRLRDDESEERLVDLVLLEWHV